MELNKKYDFHSIEKNKNEKWIKNKYFINHDLNKKPFSIILPPPNVTGKLHIGHALNAAIQDCIIRYKKLDNYDVLWLPGLDHAGIATQAKVEADLHSKKIDKNVLTKDQLFNYAQEWVVKYKNIIISQWSKLGLALDFSNERFTLDNLANQAVNKVFITLYNQGLIYRGSRAIYYDTQLQTSLSNIEVINKSTQSKMFYLKYYLDGSKEEFIEVATTRPETLASDVALVVNPKDKKYIKYISKFALNPLTNKKIKIIDDEYALQDFGTGVVKISAHDIGDFDIIKKYNLELIETIDKFGITNELLGEFKNLDRFVARDKIVEFLKEKQMITKIEEITNNVGYSERSNTIVEVLVMPQWFVKMDQFNKMILDNLNNGDSNNTVTFWPKRFKNTIIQWMENAYDWNISRQLWWGHQIPAWYKDQEVKVQVDSPGEGWTRDSDVLDTWFSSGIAPFSFLGWPSENNSLLNRYYPTNLLVTAYDIIFFWIARMYFMCLNFQNGKVPFQNVLIHGLVRDANGKKMSKSLNNGVDPMELIDQYGADALRWFLLTNTTPGLDIRYSKEKIESAWKFMNKIWNISRYILQLPDTHHVEKSAVDFWIEQKFVKLHNLIKNKIDTYDFTIIGKEIFKFIMNDFSSWYIEFSKELSNKKYLVSIWSQTLILIHPFIPFISDHIYSLMNNKELLEQSFDFETKKEKGINVDYIDTTIEIISKIRGYREEFNLSNNVSVEYYFEDKYLDDNSKEKIMILISKLGNGLFVNNKDIYFKIDNINLWIKVPNEVKSKQNDLLEKQIKFLEFEIERAKNVLENKGFVQNAPKEKIDIEKNKLIKYEEELEEILKNCR